MWACHSKGSLNHPSKILLVNNIFPFEHPLNPQAPFFIIKSTFYLHGVLFCFINYHPQWFLMMNLSIFFYDKLEYSFLIYAWAPLWQTTAPGPWLVSLLACQPTIIDFGEPWSVPLLFAQGLHFYVMQYKYFCQMYGISRKCGLNLLSGCISGE